MPDNESMEKLAAALELPVAYFHAASEPLAEMILLMSRLSPEQQAQLLHWARQNLPVQQGLSTGGE